MEVAANLSFSKGSEILFISQPAISKHIKALEGFYKTTLFERKGNTIHLHASFKYFVQAHCSFNSIYYYEYEIFLFWLLKVIKNSYQFTLVKQNSSKTFKNSFRKLER